MVDYTHRLNVAKNHIKNTNDILKANRTHILNFVDFISAEGLSKARQVKYIYNLKTVATLLNKDFNKSKKQDMVKLASKINNSDYSEWTKHDFLVETKRFYKWLKDTDDFPKMVKWIKPTMKRSKKKLPKQLLTIEDVKKLAEHTNNLRDRCLILVLYESGARIGEILNIKLKDIDNDKYGAKVTLFGKTGSRKIRLIAAAPSISNWLQEHPNKNESRKQHNNSYLFCGLWGPNKGKQLMYRHVNKLLKEAGEKAGINKPMNPHHYRHSRATELAKRFTEAQLCEYLGWVQGSKEAATYVHLSGRDTDRAILEMHGLAEEEKPESKLQTIMCPRCNTKNDPAAKFCSQCSLGLDEKSMMEFDQQKELATQTGFATQEMLQDKEFREFYNETLVQTYHKYKEMKEKEK